MSCYAIIAKYTRVPTYRYNIIHEYIQCSGWSEQRKDYRGHLLNVCRYLYQCVCVSFAPKRDWIFFRGRLVWQTQNNAARDEKGARKKPAIYGLAAANRDHFHISVYKFVGSLTPFIPTQPLTHFVFKVICNINMNIPDINHQNSNTFYTLLINYISISYIKE